MHVVPPWQNRAHKLGPIAIAIANLYHRYLYLQCHMVDTMLREAEIVQLELCVTVSILPIDSGSRYQLETETRARG